MKMKKHIKGMVLIAMIGIANIGYSQAIYKIQDGKDVAVKLKGTSSLHDWEMDAKTATGEAQFVFASGSETELESVKSLTFAIQVHNLKSDSNGLDKNAYKALKSDDFKDIQYKLSSTTVTPEKGGYLLKAKGKLTIAGVNKDIEMIVHSVVNKDGSITFKGTYALKMTDYKVEPPSFMFGAMSTGDAITLEFDVTYIS